MEADDDYDKCPPPWNAFPEIAPEDLPQHLRQGRAETYFDEIFLPFWRGLSERERSDYLAYWHASDAWRSALGNLLFDADFDPAVDAHESDAYLRGVRERAERRPWWKRWL